MSICIPTKCSSEDYRVLVHKCSEAKRIEVQENTSNSNLLCSPIKYQYNKSKLKNLGSPTPQSLCRKNFPRQKLFESDTSSTLKITPQDLQVLLVKLKKGKKSKPKNVCSGACIIT
jgi:hypothetical protein